MGRSVWRLGAVKQLRTARVYGVVVPALTTLQTGQSRIQHWQGQPSLLSQRAATRGLCERKRANSTLWATALHAG